MNITDLQEFYFEDSGKYSSATISVQNHQGEKYYLKIHKTTDFELHPFSEIEDAQEYLKKNYPQSIEIPVPDWEVKKMSKEEREKRYGTD